MKKALAIFVIAIFATNCMAENWRHPDAKFDARKKSSETIKLTWRSVDNLQQACEKESRRRGNPGFGYSLDACSFWNWEGTECVIITKNRSSLHELGHEVRHCFQGNYH